MVNNLTKYKDMYKEISSLQQRSRDLKEQSKKLYDDSCKLTKKSRRMRSELIDEVSQIIVSEGVSDHHSLSVLDIATYILDNDDKNSNKANFLYRNITKKVKTLREKSQ